MNIGAQYKTNGDCEFIVWAPFKKISLQLLTKQERIIQMEKDEKGFWRTNVENLQHKTYYRYILNSDLIRPDPVSHFQPKGIYSPSQIINHSIFEWKDSKWKGICLSDMIIYELHVGTFTPEGNFNAILPHLEELKSIGINSIELMPIAQFPGKRNWGYDCVFPFAVQNSYGGPTGLKKLVDECHGKGLALILDVIYNHLGPEGNYILDFGPYTTTKYKTPWGNAINFDGHNSDGVRNYFIENALYWFKNYHVDALRLDSIHSIYDKSKITFLQELATSIQDFSKEKGRDFYLIAENDLKNPNALPFNKLNSYGIHSQWCDDLHHCIHSLLTHEHKGYYSGFNNEKKLVQCLKNGYVDSDNKKPSENESILGRQFIVYSQNHDQVGNRINGERLSSLISFEALKLAAGIVILSHFIPLLFMGEEYAEESPFLYFAEYSNPFLIEEVRKGRCKVFNKVGLTGTQQDPFSIKTFNKSKLNWRTRTNRNNKRMLKFYKHLLKLRAMLPAISSLDKSKMDISILDKTHVMEMKRWDDIHSMLFLFNLNNVDVTIKLKASSGKWRKVFSSAEKVFGGPGSLLNLSYVSGEKIILRCHSFLALKKN